MDHCGPLHSGLLGMDNQCVVVVGNSHHCIARAVGSILAWLD